jgi:ribosome maturation factor RimP
MRAGSRQARSRPGRTGRGAASQRRPVSAARPEQPDRLARLAGPVVRAAGMDLESVEVTPAGRRRVVKVVVDADGGVSLDDMAEVSRTLARELDASDAMGDTPYTLEVSSPGVDRPLTEPRHWRRAAGRLVRVPATPQESAAQESAGQESSGQESAGQGPSAGETGRNATRILRGRVVSAGEHGVVLEIDGEQRTFGYAELGPGRVELEFGRGDGGERHGH